MNVTQRWQSKFIRINLVWVLLACYWLFPAWGQPVSSPLPSGVSPSLDPARTFTQYVHNAWQTDEGLPQNTVRAIVQTHDGYLWLGTQEGLVRFDGVRFTVFDRSTTSELASSDIVALAEDREGGLWIGTHGGGLGRFTQDRFHTYPERDGPSNREVYALHEDREGGLWMGTLGGGLTRFSDDAVAQYTAEDGLASDIVLAITEDRSGRIWVGMDGGLSLLDAGHIRSFGMADGLPGTVVRTVLEDRAGMLWVGTENGLARFENGTFTSYSTRDGLTDQIITTLYEDRAGTLWVGTLAGGLCRYRDDRFSCYTTEQGLTHDNVRAIYEDREGSLWIGTDGGGLNRLRNGAFIPLTTHEGLSHDIVYAVYEDRSGALWVGTEGGGINRLAGEQVRVYTTRDNLSSNVVLSIEEGRDGSLWVGTEGGGLNRIRGERITQYTLQNGLPGTMIRALYEAPDGSLWMGTENGLGRLKDGVVTTYTVADGLPDEVVVALVADGQGGLWIGTFGGLAHLRDGTLTAYTTDDGLSSNMVLTLHLDREGTLWVGTQDGGLNRFQDGVFTSYTTRDGMLSDVIVQILDDEHGYLWMGTNKGIFRVEKAQLADYAAARIPTIVPDVYGKADGLKSIECNGGMQPAAWRSRDGRLWFSTLHGVAMIDPSNIPTNRVRPPVTIEQVVVQGRPVAHDGTLRLPPGSDDYEFHYTALSLASPGEVRFKYRLDGQDKHWHDATDRRSAYYTNLAPGSYTFHVTAANEDGVWSEAGASIPFYVEPFFYQTPWFYAMCALSILMLGAGAYNVRVRQLRARERHLRILVDERTRDLHDEKRRVEAAKSVIEEQAVELKTLNEELEERVREQLDTILRSKRLTKYFPKKVVDQILSADAEVDLTSERRLVTVFFSDLTGFTELSERADPDAITWMLNDYLNHMVELIDHYGGTLDKFMGDGIMAFFGAPDEMDAADQALRAVCMGAAMQQRMAMLTAKWIDEGFEHRLRVRMGAHQTWATVGNFGSRELMEFTVIGRGVNFAKRLEAACTPGRIMVSAEMHALTRDHVAFEAAQDLTFKGIPYPCTVWELDPANVPLTAPDLIVSAG